MPSLLGRSAGLHHNRPDRKRAYNNRRVTEDSENYEPAGATALIRAAPVVMKGCKTPAPIAFTYFRASVLGETGGRIVRMKSISPARTILFKSGLAALLLLSSLAAGLIVIANGAQSETAAQARQESEFEVKRREAFGAQQSRCRQGGPGVEHDTRGR